jgi:hypothetical protein
MIRKIFSAFLIVSLLAAFASCSKQVQPSSVPSEKASETPKASGNTQQNSSSASPEGKPGENGDNVPAVSGIKLGDTKEKVVDVLGKDYTEKSFEDAEHFPEPFYNWEYEKGFTITIGKNTNTVLQIVTTALGAETNLNAKIGDSADSVLETYRSKYSEPNSIQSGEKLLGVFKVEKDQALIFDFNIQDGLVNPVEEIKPDETVERIILTYPAYLDESF